MTILFDNLITQGNLQQHISKAAQHYTTPLREMPYAQAQIHKYYDENNLLQLVVLQSYNTLVCAIDFIDHKIYCEGLYSATTRKQISKFAYQFSGMVRWQELTYQSFKELV